MNRNDYALAISMGLLISGLAYGDNGNEYDNNCTLQPEKGGGTFLLNLVCSPPEDSIDDSAMDEPPGGDAAVDDNATGDSASDDASTEGSATADAATGVEGDERGNASKDAVDSTTKDGVGNEQPGDQLAASSAQQSNPPADSKQDTEIFNIDREPTEAVEVVPGSETLDIFNLGGAFEKTSDDYHARTYSFSYRNRRREWFWPWEESTDHGLDWGINVDRTVGDSGVTAFNAVNAQGILGGYVTTGTYLLAQVGRHALHTDQGDRTITPRHLTAMFGLNHDFSMQLESSRDFIYTGGSVTGGITQQLTSSDRMASFRWRLHPRFRIQGRGGIRDYDQENNNNTARQADISALYGISPDVPWIWAGVGAQGLRYDREVSSYWSPKQYNAYGLRLESSFPLFGRLSGNASGSLNRQDENGTRGTGYDFSIGLEYRLYGQVYARFDLSKMKSLQKQSTWTSDNVSFTLSGPLF